MLFTDQVLLLARGDCSFVSKVWNAQQAGALGVLVVNYKKGELFMMGGTSMPALSTRGYSSTYLAMGFANVRAGTWRPAPAPTAPFSRLGLCGAHS